MAMATVEPRAHFSEDELIFVRITVVELIVSPIQITALKQLLHLSAMKQPEKLFESSGSLTCVSKMRTV